MSALRGLLAPTSTDKDENKDCSGIVRLLLCGSSMVGKSSLIDRYVNDRFKGTRGRTTGIDFSTKKISTQDGTIITLQLWDLGMPHMMTSSRFKNNDESLFKLFDGCVLVYDITRQKSFQRLDFWKDFFISNKPNITCNFPFIVVANKMDLITEIQQEKWRYKFRHIETTEPARFIVNTWTKKHAFEYKLQIPSDVIGVLHSYYGEMSFGELYAITHNMKYYEASAKSGYNVKTIFDTISLEIAKAKDVEITIYGTIPLPGPKAYPQKSCCSILCNSLWAPFEGLFFRARV